MHKQRGPSGSSSTEITPVSNLLNWTNSVLYGDQLSGQLSDSVFVPVDAKIVSQKMADGGNSEPTNRDLMEIMKSISNRLESVENKLKIVEVIEKRIGGMETDIKKLWVALDERMKKVDDRVKRVEDKVDGADILAAQMASRIDELKKVREAMREDVS